MLRSWLRKWLGIDDGLNDLQREINSIKLALEEKRVVKWIRAVKYMPGMTLKYDTPQMISLVQLQADIARIDSHLRGIKSDRRFKTKKRNDWRA